MSTDLHTLSGAYALDAMTAEEAEQFRRHLDGCQVCRQEVHELQAAASAMGASEVIVPPEHLRARILGAVDRMPQLPPRGRGGVVVHVAPHRWGRRFLLAVAAVVLVVGGAVGIDQLQGQDEQQGLLAREVVQVFEAEDANTATMETANGGRISVATSPGRGEMAVDTDELPPLDEEHVYQLWAIQDGTVTSVGILQPEKGVAMGMPEPDVEVAITVEPAGGSDRPTTEPIMRVNPHDV